MIKSRSIIVACLLLFCVSGNAQTENLYDFDQKKWHFGFALSYNQSDFYLYRSNTTSFPKIHYNHCMLPPDLDLPLA